MGPILLVACGAAFGICTELGLFSKKVAGMLRKLILIIEKKYKIVTLT